MRYYKTISKNTFKKKNHFKKYDSFKTIFKFITFFKKKKLRIILISVFQ